MNTRLNKRKLLTLAILLVLAGALSACTTVMPDRSWPESVVVDDLVYTTNHSFTYAVNPADWKEAVGYGDPEKLRYPKEPEENTSFGTAPVLFGDNLLLSDFKSHLRIVSKDLTKQISLAKDATGRYLSSPAVAGDLILAANTDHHLYAYDQNLKLKWKWAAKDGIWTKPVVLDDLIFVASIDKNVYALRQNAAGNGADVVWSKDLGGSVFFSLTVDEVGNLFIGTLNNELYSIEGKTGKVNWQVATAGTVWSPVIIKGDRIFGADQSGRIFSLKKSDGTTIWEYEAKSHIIGSVALNENSLYAGTHDGDAICLSNEDKPASRLLWTQKVGGKLYSTPVFVGDYVVFGMVDGDGVLTAFKLSGDAGGKFKPSK